MKHVHRQIQPVSHQFGTQSTHLPYTTSPTAKLHPNAGRSHCLISSSDLSSWTLDPRARGYPISFRVPEAPTCLTSTTQSWSLPCPFLLTKPETAALLFGFPILMNGIPIFFSIFEARNLGVIPDSSLSPAFCTQLITKSNQFSRHNRCWVATMRNEVLLSWRGRHNVMIRCGGGGGRNATQDALGERRNNLIIFSRCY